MAKEILVVSVVDYDNNIKSMVGCDTLADATQVVRRYLFKQATDCLNWAEFDEEYKTETIAKAHAKYDNLKVKLDKEGYWSHWIGGSWSDKVVVRKIKGGVK